MGDDAAPLGAQLWEACGLPGNDDRIMQILADGSSDVNGTGLWAGVLRDRNGEGVYDFSGASAIHWAAYHGRLSAVMILIDHGADVMQKDSRGATAFHAAMYCKADADTSLQVATLLLATNSEAIISKTDNGSSPLHYAAVAGACVEVIAALLAANPAAAMEKDSEGLLPLLIAAAKGCSAEVVAALLAANPAAAMEKDAHGCLPLHYLITSAHSTRFPEKAYAVVVALLTATGGFSAIDSEGSTALHILVEYREYASSVRQLILEHPELVHARNAMNKTPIDVARGKTGAAECLEAMYSALFFDGRFELDRGRAAHESPNCLVVFATDHGERATEGAAANNNPSTTRVALKFMMHEIQFRREVEIRRSGEDSGLDKAVLGIRGWRRFRTTHLGAEDDDDTLADAFGAVGRWTTSDFKDFCQAGGRAGGFMKIEGQICPSRYIVMDQADRDLFDVINRENFCGIRWDTISFIAHELGACLQNLHDNQIIHGDFKPRNAVRLVEEARRDAETRDDYVKDRVGDIDKWQLIDLDASVSLIDAGGSPSTSTGRFSWRFLLCSAWLSGFVSSPTGGTGQQKDDTAWRGRRRRRPPPHADERYLTRKRSTGYCPPNVFKEVGKTAVMQDTVLAHPAHDVWAFGATLYEMCSSQTLWTMNKYDTIPESAARDLKELCEWTDQVKAEKLSFIPDAPVAARQAKRLLGEILQKDPAKRPSMKYVLDDVFFDSPMACEERRAREDRRAREANARSTR